MLYLRRLLQASTGTATTNCLTAFGRRAIGKPGWRSSFRACRRPPRTPRPRRDRLTERFAADRERLATEGRKAGSALRVHEALQERPILSIPETCKRTGLAFPTVSAAMRLLETTGLVREITGFSRNRVYVYDEYLRILNEGVEGE